MYIFYIDESGQREYGEKTSRYFVLCGLAVQDAHWKFLNDRINELKITYFRDPRVELKSNWIRIPSLRSDHYLEKYNIHPNEFDEFMEKVYELIEVFLNSSFYCSNRQETNAGTIHPSAKSQLDRL